LPAAGGQREIGGTSAQPVASKGATEGGASRTGGAEGEVPVHIHSREEEAAQPQIHGGGRFAGGTARQTGVEGEGGGGAFTSSIHPARGAHGKGEAREDFDLVRGDDCHGVV